jgi:transposase
MTVQTWQLLQDGGAPEYMYHDNARPHSANQTTATLRSFKLEVLHHPPYSSDLSPSDFDLFGPLKHHLSGERFPDDDAVERAVRAWFQQQPKLILRRRFPGACETVGQVFKFVWRLR